MIATNPFGGPQPDRVCDLTDQLVLAYTAASAPIAHAMIFDASLDIPTMMAAVAQAHAHGLVKAIVAGAEGDMNQLVDHIAAWMRVEIATAKAKR